MKNTRINFFRFCFIFFGHVCIQVWQLGIAPGDQTCRVYIWQKKSFTQSGFDDKKQNLTLVWTVQNQRKLVIKPGFETCFFQGFQPWNALKEERWITEKHSPGKAKDF